MPKADYKPLLPAGFHPRDWAQLNELCVEGFPEGSPRPALAKKLQAFIDELKSFEVGGEIWIDGSFATEKPDPSDVDIVWVVDPAAEPAVLANRARIEQLFGTPRGAKALYGCDAFLVPSTDVNRLAYWRGLFGFGHDAKSPKGIIVLAL